MPLGKNEGLEHFSPVLRNPTDIIRSRARIVLGQESSAGGILRFRRIVPGVIGDCIGGGKALIDLRCARFSIWRKPCAFWRISTFYSAAAGSGVPVGSLPKPGVAEAGGG